MLEFNMQTDFVDLHPVFSLCYSIYIYALYYLINADFRRQSRQKEKRTELLFLEFELFFKL